MAICTIIAVHYGLGEHALLVPPDNFAPFIQVCLLDDLDRAWGMILKYSRSTSLRN